MPSLPDIRKKIAQLEAQATALEGQERSKAVKTVRELIEKFALTKKEIGTVRGGKTGPRKSVREPKYRNPETGATWNGWGKPPAWMPKSPESRAAYLINGAAKGAVKPKAAKAKKAAPAKAAKKTAAKRSAEKSQAAPAKKSVKATTAKAAKGPAKKATKTAPKKVAGKKSAVKKAPVKKTPTTAETDKGSGGATAGNT